MFSEVRASGEVQFKMQCKDFQQLRWRDEFALLDDPYPAANCKFVIKDRASRSVGSGTGDHQVLLEGRAWIRSGNNGRLHG